MRIEKEFDLILWSPPPLRTLRLGEFCHCRAVATEICISPAIHTTWRGHWNSIRFKNPISDVCIPYFVHYSWAEVSSFPVRILLTFLKISVIIYYFFWCSSAFSSHNSWKIERFDNENDSSDQIKQITAEFFLIVSTI